ncbi:Hypothetical protein POVR1_LOCUS324 [uncultured virus]|nr:Hypothetical protein POVR1_LOCUS324 [uncultured virus]
MVTSLRVIKELNASWNKEILGTKVQYNMELAVGNLTGHPDIMTESAVLDIKTTSSFKSIGKESCLQILGDYIIYCGVVLPMQREIQTVDLSTWNYRPFRKLLEEKSQAVMTIQLIPDLLQIYPVGRHVCKDRSYLQTIKNFSVTNLPMQMFLRNTQTGKRSPPT